MNEPKYGELYKYPDSEHLYLIATINIGDCMYNTLVNVSTGYVNGPSSGAIGELVEGMTKVADSVKELVK